MDDTSSTKVCWSHSASRRGLHIRVIIGIMIKLTFCLRRRPEMTREEFQRYWRDNHAPLVAERAGILGIKRYVQFHSFATDQNAAIRASRGGPEQYDGVAELWWESWDDLAAAGATPEGRQAAADLLEDEKRFIDLSDSPLWLGEEHQIV